MREQKRQKHLHTLAEQDEIFIMWKTSYEESADKFTKIVKRCPKNVRNILCCYAESGRLMYQRMVNIACEYMDFCDYEEHTQ